MNPRKTEALSPQLQTALQPLLTAIEMLSQQIREYNERIEELAEKNYPQVQLLKQVKGVGTLIALTFLLTLEDPHRFRKSRDVGCYLGLQPGRRNSGQSEPQMHISKEGDPYLRTTMERAVGAYQERASRNPRKQCLISESNPTDLVGRTLKECHTVVLFEADSDTARMSLPG
jgi:transposase